MLTREAKHQVYLKAAGSNPPSATPCSVRPLLRRSVLFIVLGFAVIIAKASASDQAPSAFALISPQVAARLQRFSGSPEAHAVIAAADQALLRDPNPTKIIHMQGTLPHQGLWDPSIKSRADLTAMLHLALAWQITHDPRYLQAEEKYLTAWMNVYRVSFNPIDETPFDQLLLAYDLTRSDLSSETRGKVESFLQTMSRGYLTKIHNTKDPGNWQSHRIKLATLAAFSLGDDALIAAAREAFDRHVAENIEPDGSTFDFHQRDALHYTVYDLEPLTMAALAARAHGQDWFDGTVPGQPSVPEALDWLVPYALGEKTHEEFVHSQIPFDARRAEAGLKEYSGTWDPKHSADLFHMAAVFNPRYQAVYSHLAQEGAHLPDWSILLIRAGN